MSDVTELTAAEKLISLENLARYDENIKGHIQDRLSDISGAVVDAELSETSTNAVQNKIITEELNKKINASEIADWAKAESKPEYTAEEVGADPVGSANTAKTESNAYTDEKIAALINGAPTTLDTLKEIADAMAENESVVDALETAIGTKANKDDIPTSLPANGGNADTLDGLHSSSLLQNLGYLETGDIRAYAMSATSGSVFVSPDVTNAPSSSWWFISIDKPQGTHILLRAIDITTALAYRASYNASTDTWTDWLKENDGGNADTVDGLHASNFVENMSATVGYYPSTLFADHAYITNIISSDIPNVPEVSHYHHIILRNNDGTIVSIMSIPTDYTKNVYVYQAHTGEWTKVADGGNADTVDGLHSSDLITGSTFTQLTSSVNDCYTAGTYSVEAAYTPDFPQGYGNYGLLDVRRYGSIVYQTIRYETGVIINRATVIGQTNWTAWARVNDNGNADTAKHTTTTLLGTSGYCEYSSILDWANNNVYNSWAFVIAGHGVPTDAPINAEAMITLETEQNDRQRKIVTWKTYGSNNIRCRNIFNGAWNGDWFNPADGGNANTVQGIDGYHIGTLASDGGAHASGVHLMYCQHNLFGDGRFGIGVPDFEIRVDYANGATKAIYADSVADTPSNVCLRNMSSGTAAATTTNCPSGAWHGQHD